MSDTFARRAIAYFTRLSSPPSLPNGVETVNPYASAPVRDVVNRFFEKFYSDASSRVAVLGINPGRFGGGVTGISFTDPVALHTHGGIAHPFPHRAELSSQFVYEMITQFGGAADFFAQFYLSALYPLALVKDGKNYNYYDDPALYAALEPAIASSLHAQIAFGVGRRVAVALGQKNAQYLERLNRQHHFFDTIIPLDHPRFIMQYRRQRLPEYVQQYVRTLQSAIAVG